MVSSMLEDLLTEGPAVAEVNVFDFDDTLVRTKSHIYLTTRDGRHVALTPHQYAVYEEQPGDQFDFRDFQMLKDPSPIKHMLYKLHLAIRNLGPDNVFILTARGAGEPIRKFLEGMGIDNIRVIALGNSDPKAKAHVIRDEVLKRRVGLVKFYDDSEKNIDTVRALRFEPAFRERRVQVIAVHVK